MERFAKALRRAMLKELPRARDRIRAVLQELPAGAFELVFANVDPRREYDPEKGVLVLKPLLGSDRIAGWSKTDIAVRVKGLRGEKVQLSTGTAAFGSILEGWAAKSGGIDLENPYKGAKEAVLALARHFGERLHETIDGLEEVAGWIRSDPAHPGLATPEAIRDWVQREIEAFLGPVMERLRADLEGLAPGDQNRHNRKEALIRATEKAENRGEDFPNLRLGPSWMAGKEGEYYPLKGYVVTPKKRDTWGTLPDLMLEVYLDGRVEVRYVALLNPNRWQARPEQGPYTTIKNGLEALAEDLERFARMVRTELLLRVG